MTDRELLEAAAKAAGVTLHVWGTKSRENYHAMLDDGASKRWNPLTDDADAFDLMIRLNIVVMPDKDKGRSTAVRTDIAIVIEQHSDHGGDASAATRRAIVRAAAAP